MAKSVGEVMDGLGQDVVLWKAEVVRMRAEGDFSTLERLEKIIANAELVLTTWNKPRTLKG
jgi:hypothetical protein